MASVYGVVVVAVIAATVRLALPQPRPVVTVPDTGEVAYVDAYMSGFSTQRLTAKVGVPLTVVLRSMDSSFHSDGGGKHQFAIDELDVNIIAPPKGVSQASFTPTAAGTYTFYCDVCCGGRANPSMQGQLVVTA